MEPAPIGEVLPGRASTAGCGSCGDVRKMQFTAPLEPTAPRQSAALAVGSVSPDFATGRAATPTDRVLCNAASGDRMTQLSYTTALIVGAGEGLSASLARALSRNGLRVGLAARNPEKLQALSAETGAATFVCDAQEQSEVERMFAAVEAQLGMPDVVIYNASARTRGPLVALDPEDVRRTLMVTAFGAFLVARSAASRMLPGGHGAILFTGASASVKGYAESAPFAMGKFALRGLAQSMARELSPKGIHVAHFVIDGAIRRRAQTDERDATLDPDAIASTYLAVLMQPRSAWTWEVELRPWVERF